MKNSGAPALVSVLYYLSFCSVLLVKPSSQGKKLMVADFTIRMCHFLLRNYQPLRLYVHLALRVFCRFLEVFGNLSEDTLLCV